LFDLSRWVFSKYMIVIILNKNADKCLSAYVKKSTIAILLENVKFKKKKNLFGLFNKCHVLSVPY
jgi:hypothetical protein